LHSESWIKWMLPQFCSIWQCHQATGWKPCMVRERDSTAFASTINGESASSGSPMEPTQLRLWITTEEGKTMPTKMMERPAEGWKIQRTTTHPGEILLHDFLQPMGISAHALAVRTRMPATRISEIIHGRRSISSDTALRLARFFGVSAEFWINLQTAYDLSKARLKSNALIQKEIEPMRLDAVA
jgi:addiction module HigA family antidote